MLSQKILTFLNRQIAHELSNSMLYRQLAAKANLMGYLGIEKFFLAQVEEEFEHYQKITEYVTNRNYLIDIQSPESPFKTVEKCKTVLDLFEASLERELLTTKMIKEMRSAAMEEDDQVTEVFLNEFISIQYKEEEEFYDLVSEVKACGNEKSALRVFDSEIND